MIEQWKLVIYDIKTLEVEKEFSPTNYTKACKMQDGVDRQLNHERFVSMLEKVELKQPKY